MNGWCPMPDDRPVAAMQESKTITLCRSDALIDSGEAMPFEVLYAGQRIRAFAVRFAGGVHAYLNRCAHIPMEMDYVPNRFFDLSGQCLMCATHGAIYSPTTGACRAGPCRSGLVKIAVTERDGMVYWHTDSQTQPTSD